MLGLRVVILVCYIKFVVSDEPVKVQFLRGVNRLSMPEYTDFYFCCNARGLFLQWQYNSELLNAFLINDEVGHSLVNQRSDYVFTGTLLSSEPIEFNQRAMDSILVVSFRGAPPSNFSVSCSNGPNSPIAYRGEIAGAADSSAKHSNSSSYEDIILDYITSGDIVRNGTTHIFVCGANYSSQLLQANGPPISFSSSDEVGFHRAASASTYTVNIQGIFIGHDPSTTTSLFIVANENEVEVSCFFGSARRQIYSSSTTSKPAATQQPDTTQQLGTNTDMSTNIYEQVSASSTKTPLNIPEITVKLGARPVDVMFDRDSSSVPIAIAVVVVGTILVILATIITIAGILFFKCYKGIKYVSKSFEKEVKIQEEFNQTSIQEGKQVDMRYEEINVGGDPHRKLEERSRKKFVDSQPCSTSPPSLFNLSPESEMELNSQEDKTEEDLTELAINRTVQVRDGGCQFAKMTGGNTEKLMYVEEDGITVTSPITISKSSPQLIMYMTGNEVRMRPIRALDDSCCDSSSSKSLYSAPLTGSLCS